MDFHGRQEYAVWGRSVSKSYGIGKGKVQVLQDLDFTVQRGRIYGLLGASGCGKTTLLKCILGQLHADAGHIVALGNAEGQKLPGNQVGYMPQEMALFHDLTIGETLRYFGVIHGMSLKEIERQTDFLMQLLSLPPANRMVNTLSVGQKRRVSFSIALLHNPKLLVLDEPTVGVDPVLRQRIWEHLINVCGSHHETTVIITTHYIEEAGKADMVGFMRNGKLLAEEHPQKLMTFYRINNLETVFLRLCDGNQTEEELGHCHFSKELYSEPTRSRRPSQSNQAQLYRKSRQTSADRSAGNTDVSLLIDKSGNDDKRNNSNMKSTKRFDLGLQWPSMRNLLSESVRDLIHMKRNIKFLLFMFVFPSIIICLFFICIGRKPHGLSVSTIDDEQSGYSKEFLRTLNSETLKNTAYSSLNSAIQSVKDGHSWGVIRIGRNFSMGLLDRFMSVNSRTLAIKEESEIKMYLDMTNPQIALTIYQSVVESFTTFCRSLLKSVNLNPSAGELPIVLSDPVYGTNNLTSVTSSISPGAIISTVFALATASTTMIFVTEKREGLLARAIISGMTAFEIMLAHVMTQLCVLVLQLALILIIGMFAFNVLNKGSLVLVMMLGLEHGFCGMALGAVFATICDDEKSALQLALGFVYPMILLSGVMWPLEAIPPEMRYISVLFPTTYGSQGLRAIMLKGFDITYMEVWRGFLVTFGWSFGLLAIAGFILRMRHL